MLKIKTLEKSIRDHIHTLENLTGKAIIKVDNITERTVWNHLDECQMFYGNYTATLEDNTTIQCETNPYIKAD